MYFGSQDSQGFAKFSSIHCLAWDHRTIIIIKENTTSWECLCIRIIKPIIKIQLRFVFFLNPCMAFCEIFSQKLCMHWVTWMRGVNKIKFIYLPMHALKFALLLSVLLSIQLWCCVTAGQDFETFIINEKNPNQGNIHRRDFSAQMNTISSVFSD